MTEAKTCSSCGTAPAGPGGILCAPCKDRISARTVTYWYPPDWCPPEILAAADTSEEPRR